MAIDFPDSPAVNDVYSTGGRTWRYNGTSWLLTSVEQTIAPLSIDASKIAADSVTTAKIAANAVTSAKLDSGIITFVTCTSSTRPSSPATGQPIFETDTFQLLFWNGSSWMNGGLRPPLQPTGLSATPGTTTVDISFTAGSSPLSAITNYEYALSTNGGTSYGSWTALSPADATSPITITGLTMATSYYVKLRGVNSIGSGVESSAVSFTTTSTLSIDYLIVAGGGSGGARVGGGGGAGGLLSGSASLSPATYSVTVGAGGTAVTQSGATGVAGNSGSNSVFNSLTATGGGGGGAYSGINAKTGGSGGGAAGYNTGGAATGAAGTAGQGFAGGNGVNGSGGGGGGSSAIGTNGSSGNGGAGGAGTASSITGSSVTYAGGGGGSGDSAGGSGGSGGGGAGTTGGTTPATSGTANTGGGGGGVRNIADGNNFVSGAGGSGVVIVRYLTSAATGFTITGGTSTTSGSYTIRTFNSSGSLVIS